VLAGFGGWGEDYMAGMFITFEGIEGCGKTTQVRLLEEFLKLRSHDVVLTREPGGTRIGDQIRKILLSIENRGMFPVTELFLYAAARNQHVQEVIIPALKDGKIVLCDRFADATTAYQGAARKIEKDFLDQVHFIATGGLKPDLTIVLDCPAEVGLNRARIRNEKNNIQGVEDRFEQETMLFHERVRQGYLDIAQKEPSRVKVVNAMQSVEDVNQKIIQEVMRILK
jgi:dTMP kinase